MSGDIWIEWVGIVEAGKGACSALLDDDLEFVPGSLNLRPAQGQPRLVNHFSGNVRPAPHWMPVQVWGVLENQTRVLVGLGNGDLTELRCATRLRRWFDDGDPVHVYIPAQPDIEFDKRGTFRWP